jgi:hypothetical protein
MLDGAVADETARPNAEDPMRTGLKQALPRNDRVRRETGRDVVLAEEIWFRNLLIGLFRNA